MANDIFFQEENEDREKLNCDGWEWFCSGHTGTKINPAGPLVQDVQCAARNTSGVQENCQAEKGQGQKELDIISTQETDEVIEQVRLQMKIESENTEELWGKWTMEEE